MGVIQESFSFSDKRGKRKEQEREKQFVEDTRIRKSVTWMRGNIVNVSRNVTNNKY